MPQRWTIIWGSLIVAFLLTLLPMPEWAVWLRPQWVLIVLIYWCMALPYRVNVGTAWFVGIMLDVLNGTLLGEHALALTITLYFVSRLHTRLRMFPLVQQGLSVSILTLIYLSVIFCVQGFLGELPRDWLYWSSAFTSMLLWPWVSSILRDFQLRFKVI